jgi:hypothetical protein
MDKDKVWKLFFLIAGIYTILVAVIFIAGSLLMVEEVSALFGAEIPPSLVWMHGYFVLVLIFGLMLLLIAKDPEKYRILIQFGTLEKLSVLPLFAIYVGIGDFNALALGPAIIDAVLGILYIVYLIGSKKS